MHRDLIRNVKRQRPIACFHFMRDIIHTGPLEFKPYGLMPKVPRTARDLRSNANTAILVAATP